MTSPTDDRTALGLIARLDYAIDLFDRIAGWPEDDWQGLKYAAYQLAEALREAATALRKAKL